MTTTTYSLDEAAAIICGGDESGNPLPGKVKWLVRRLRSGEIRGYKAGRQWRLTAADVDAAIEKLRPRIVRMPDVPQFSGLRPTSRRRLAG